MNTYLIREEELVKMFEWQSGEYSKGKLLQVVSNELDRIFLEMVNKGKIGFSTRGKIYWMQNKFMKKYRQEEAKQE